MKTVLKLSARNIRANLGRLILTTIAIIAGVGFVSGSFILADSVSDTFTNIFENAGAATDARVQVSDLEFGDDERTLADSVVAEIEALPETGKVTPIVTLAQFRPFVALDAAGEEVVPRGPPIITFSWDGSTNAIDIVEGTPPQNIDEVAMDAAYATAVGASVGDTVNFVTPQGPRSFRLATIIDFEVTAGAYFVLFDFDSAQVLYDKVGTVDSIELGAAAGTPAEAMIAAVSEILPDDAEVIGQQQLIDNDLEGFNAFIGIFRNALLGFAGIALFVSLFIIYNTFAILINQRLAQIGMLRAIGATAGQIRQSVMIEALLVGIVGSALGLLAGVGVAFLIKQGFQATGGFPETGTVITKWTVLISLGVGIGATLLSALGPAFAASRVSPVAAMRNEGPSRGSLNRRVISGGIITTFGLILLGLGLFVGGQGTKILITELGVGAVLTFVGVALLSVLFAGPIVNFIGRPAVLGGTMAILGILLPVFMFTVGKGLPGSPFSAVLFAIKLLVSIVAIATGISILISKATRKPFGLGGSGAGLEGRLARQNAARSPQRTAATATALTIGIALISTVATVGESLKATFTDSLASGVQADLFIYDQETQSPFSGELAARIREVDGISAVSSFRANEIRIGQDVKGVAAYNTETGTSLIELNISSGSALDIGAEGVLVYSEEAIAQNFRVGDRISVDFPDGESSDLTVAGIFDDKSVLDSDYVIDIDLLASHISNNDDLFVAAAIAEGADPEAVKAKVSKVTDEFSSVVAQDNQEFRETQEGQIDGLITLINMLLGFALFVAFLGVINTIVLSVVERTREIGLLRAIGTTRKQMRSTIRWEAVIVCLFGAIIGIVLGMLFAAAAITAIPDSVIDTISVPYESVIFSILVAALAGVLAALFPAIRASNMNVLKAISTS